MEITLTRSTYRADCTLGVIACNHDLLCFTLENPWLDNKINISCIPEGNYRCEPHEGARHKETWMVTNVDNRSGIVIHVGNTESDTKGCILPGSVISSKKGKRAVLGSRLALEKLRNYIGISNGFDLIIKSA